MESSGQNGTEDGPLKERSQEPKQWRDGIMFMDVEGKTKATAAQGGEQAPVCDELQDTLQSNIADARRSVGGGVNIVQQQSRKDKEERKHALKISPAGRKRGSTEEDFILIPEEIVGKENVEVQTSLEFRGPNEMAERQGERGFKVEKGRSIDNSARDRVWNLEAEKGRLHKDLSNMTLKETILRERVKEFELEMEGHRKRAEKADTLILELQQSAAHSSYQARQVEADLDAVQKVCLHKDEERKDLQNLVARLQKLCMDHEKSIHGLRQGLKNGMDRNKEERMSQLQRELHRLCGVEVALRSELEALRAENDALRWGQRTLLERLRNGKRDNAACMKMLDQQLRADHYKGIAQAAELRDENSSLCEKLRFAMRERQSMKAALIASEEELAELLEENEGLQRELAEGLSILEAKDRDVHDLEHNVEALTTSNQMLRAALSLREKTVVACGMAVKEREKEVREAQHTESKMRGTLEVNLMNGRAEVLTNKLLEPDAQLVEPMAQSFQKDDVIPGLEQILGDLARAVESQNSCVVRLSVQNEELAKVSQSQMKQIEDLQAEIATAVRCKDKAESEIEILQARVEEWEQEVEEQNLHCEMLGETVVTMEADLKQCYAQVTLMLRSHEQIKVERKQLQCSLDDASLRVAELEEQLREKKEAMESLEANLEDLTQEVEKGREELSRVSQQRDEMQREADSMGREALHTSLQVELLRRRVHELDEEVLVKDGQIAILRSSLEGGEGSLV